MTLIKAKNIEDYLPAVKCPNYQRNQTVVDLEKDCYKAYFSELKNETKALIVRRTLTAFKLESVVTPNLQIDKINPEKCLKLFNDYLKWPIDYWYWKPTILKTKSLKQIIGYFKQIYKNIKTIRMIKSESYPLDESEFEKLLNFLITYKPIKVSLLNTHLRYPWQTTNRIRLKSKSLVFARNLDIIPCKIEWSEIYLEGTIKDRFVIYGEEWVGFEVSNIHFPQFSIIQYDEESNFKQYICYSQIDQHCSDYFSNLILFHIEDINMLEDWDSESIAILSKFSNFKNIKYQIHIYREDTDLLMNRIDLIPRDSDIQVSFDWHYWDAILELPIEFWNAIIEFKSNVCLGINNQAIIQRIKILQVIWNINQNDFKTKFLKVKLDGKEKKLNLSIFYKLVTGSIIT